MATPTIHSVEDPNPDDKRETAIRAFQDLPQSQQREVVEATAAGLSLSDREIVANLLGRPDHVTSRVLWYLVVGSLVSSIFIFGVLAVLMIYSEKGGEIPLALATAALGGVLGLVSTSPGSRI